MQKKVTLHSLTGIRFIAALLIFLYHFIRFADMPDWFNNILGFGGHWVDMFFLLSGFMLTYNYVDRDDTNYKVGFIVSRVAKIMPLYYLSLLITIPLFVRYLLVELKVEGTQFVSLAAIIASTVGTFTQTWFSWKPIGQIWNTPAWAMSNIVIFYLLFPLILPLIKRVRLLGNLVIVVVSLGLILFFDGLIIPLLPESFKLLDVESIFMWKTNPIYNIPIFILGCALAKVYLGVIQYEIQSNKTVKIALTILEFVAVFIVFYYFATLNREMSQACTSGFLRVSLFTVLVLVLSFGMGPISWILSQKPIYILGCASYSFYIFQVASKFYFQQFCSKILGLNTVDNLYYQIALIVVAITVSLLLYYLVETPLNKKVRGFFAKKWNNL